MCNMTREQIARAIDPVSWAAWDSIMTKYAKEWRNYSEQDKAYYADCIAFVRRPGRKPSLEAAERVFASLFPNLAVAGEHAHQETASAA